MNPISPEEIYENKENYVPTDIVDIVNAFLGARYVKNGKVTMLQEEIVREFLQRNPNNTETEMIENGWLDFEDIYRKQGWLVIYRKPDERKLFSPYYEFQSSKK